MGLAREASFLWYVDVGFNVIGKTDTAGNRIDYFDPHDQTIKDVAWDGAHLWAINLSGTLKQFETTGLLDTTISGLMSNGWGLTYDGCYLWASDPVNDRIYRVALPLHIETYSLADGFTGHPYSVTLVATGGCPPYMWSLLSGSLPDGLNLDSSGTISGVPTTVQTAEFTVTVYDSTSTSQTRDLSITIVEGSYCEDDAKRGLPTSFVLLPNHPNPFNPSTDISYSLPVDCEVRMEVFSLNGRRVACLINGRQTAGFKTIRWDAHSCASGIYFCRLQADHFLATGRMVLIK